MQIEDLKKEIEQITGLKVFEINITNLSQFNIFLKLCEDGLMKNNIYIAKSNTFLEVCYEANRDFIIYYKRKILQFSTMEKSTREMIKNMSHDIKNECCICYESNVEMSGCESCTANFCIPCGIKLLNDNYELFCPCCKRFLFKLEL